ncbi:hypothetical protein FHC21_21190 [Enterobacter roggenkampii]|nr:hypothetical protein [Enterobacter roggenkampii]
MHYGTFTPYNGNNNHARYKVVAYHSDTLLQDKRVDVTTAIPVDLIVGDLVDTTGAKEGANKQVISSQADSLIKISRIWADFFPANTSNQPI